jgi:uncharacterized protein (DUF58 family)
MTRFAGPRLEGYAILSGVGLVAALALRRPELAVLAAPFALLLAAGLRAGAEPEIEASFSLEAERTVENAEVAAELHLRVGAPVDLLEVLLVVPDGVEIVEGPNGLAAHLARDEERTVELRLRCRTWGLYDIGTLRVRVRTRLRVVGWETTLDRCQRLKVYPSTEELQRIVAPRETQVFTGSEVARVKGDGIEYADLREYVAGDRLRSINWRASARRGDLVVNERHPERNTDVVLFLDSFADVRGNDRSTLDDAVRTTATLAARYLERRDRVGLVTFGGVLRWLQPGMGVAQRFRLVDALLETGVEPTYTWRDVNIIPARILPPKALILAVTPLVDPRFVSTLADLKARGFDVAVIEVDPIPAATRAASEPERLAFRLWILEREILRSQVARLGIAVARPTDDFPLDTALEEVRTFRRKVGVARV